jgi:hypothetical protein
MAANATAATNSISDAIDPTKACFAVNGSLHDPQGPK